MLERAVQQKCVRHARTLGVTSHKFSSEARRNVPDYLHLYRGRTYFVEYKAEGKRANKGQLREHRKLREQGFTTHIIDGVSAGNTLMALFVMNLLPDHAIAI